MPTNDDSEAFEARRADALARLRLDQLEARITALEMAQERSRFDLLKTPALKPVAVSAFDLFQTPEAIADKMAETCRSSIYCNTPHRLWRERYVSRILEPSAGLGRIVRAIADRIPEASVVMVEDDADCCRELYQACPSAQLYQRDFLELTPEETGLFSGVVMNPPFKQGRDIEHIRHAFNFLMPKGVLVALCYNGVKQTAQLKPWADAWVHLPDGAFKESGTGAGVVMLTKVKRAE